MTAFTIPDDADRQTYGPSLRADDGLLLAYRRVGGSPRFRLFVREATFVFVRRGTKRIHRVGSVRIAAAGRFVLMLPGIHAMSETAGGPGAYESTLASFSGAFLRRLRSSQAKPTLS